MITSREFKVAMDLLGVKRLYNRSISKSSSSKLCYELAGLRFFHSKRFVTLDYSKTPTRILEQAMAEFGEEPPIGGENFWFNEIHSLKGLITFATMLLNKYSKEYVNDLLNKAYMVLFDVPTIKDNMEFQFQSDHLPKELYELLAKHRDSVNPFASKDFRKENQTLNLNHSNISININDGNGNTYLEVSTEFTQTKFEQNKYGWSYKITAMIQKAWHNSNVELIHYYNNGQDKRPTDEIIYLNYKVNKGMKDEDPNDIDLRISLKTGLAWKTYKDAEAMLATDEQIEKMIESLEISIRAVEENIIKKMIKEE